MINKSKAVYLQYRERARELYECGAVAHGDRHGSNVVLESVSVPLNANVQICDDGAYVEAIVWVPAEKFERPVQSRQHTTACRAYGNYQPPYEDCTCGADKEQ